VTAALAATALAAPKGSPPQKVNFLDNPVPNGSYCYGATPGTGPVNASYATIKLSGVTITADVVLKSAVPNITYVVVLYQSGCLTTPPSETLTTNAQGNGKVQVTATRASNDASVYVASVDAPGPVDIKETPAVTFGP
jgi:hypothetical protein